MKQIVDFLIKVSILKETPRKGWVLRGVPNPETIAEHIFGVTMLSWILAYEAGLDTKRVIKIALGHDLCEVYAGDITADLYYPKLPKDKRLREKVLNKWARLSKRTKEKAKEVQFNREKNALIKLINKLPLSVKNEIFSSWIHFEKDKRGEGKFVNQLNRVETLIQSIEYFGSGRKKEITGWWEWVEEIVEYPIILNFLELIQEVFYHKNSLHKKRDNLYAILNFFLKINKLKKMERLYWRLRGIKNGETIAGHTFSLALMAWLFGIIKNDKKVFDQGKLLKMALCHELSAVYTGDTTPYDQIISKNKKKKDEILSKMIRLPKSEKEHIFKSEYKEEKRSLQKLTKGLNPILRNEIIGLWSEYRLKSSLEAKLLSQLNVASVLFQGLIYESQQKKFSTFPLWEWAFEVSDDPLVLEMLDEMKKIVPNYRHNKSEDVQSRAFKNFL